MAIANRVRRAMEEGGWIRRMFEVGIGLKAEYGEDKVFDLSLGNPVLEPPERFNEELRRLAASPVAGMHRYMPNAGYPETRAAVAETLRGETGLAFGGGDVVMSCGAAGGINVVLGATLDPGDEVIILAPYFGEYVYYVDNHNGRAVIAPTTGDFRLDLGAIEAAVTGRTRGVIINSPNNPSGVVYAAGEIRELGELLRRKGAELNREIYIISDEPYRRLIYDGLTYPQVFPHYERTIVVNSHAKDLGLPGERIGYIAVHPDYPGKTELVDGLIFCTRTLGFVNAPALMQHLVRGLQEARVEVGEYQRKRDFLYGGLIELGYSVVKPEGAFYLFPKSPLADDAAFVEVLQEWQVLAVPGRGFGVPGHFRLSYCVEDWVLAGALEGLAGAGERCGG